MLKPSASVQHLVVGERIVWCLLRPLVDGAGLQWRFFCADVINSYTSKNLARSTSAPEINHKQPRATPQR